MNEQIQNLNSEMETIKKKAVGNIELKRKVA